MRVGRNADDEITVERGRIFEATLGGESDRLLFRLVEVPTVLEQLGAQRTHRRVFLGRIAVRDHDRHGNTGPCPGESQRLAVIAARRGDDSSYLRTLTFQPVEI